MLFAFNQVIPLEIVSFYSFSYLITMHPKIGKSLCNALFKGERRVEGNSNLLSSVQMSERVMLELERVRITFAHESVRIFSFP